VQVAFYEFSKSYFWIFWTVKCGDGTKLSIHVWLFFFFGFLPNVGLPQTLLEMILIDNGIKNLTTLGNGIDPVCVQAALNFACADSFPFCQVDPADNATAALPVCWSTCERFTELCMALLEAENR